ncbi:MAG: ABC transporter permease [Bacteroidales bacterium]|nr:ABC transporter permease [Bacteroidales bacterium]
MKILSLSISQLKSKPFNSTLSICMFALGVGIISLLLHFEQFAQKQLAGNLAGIDLVAGAKGSPLQLIMSSVLHADNPTGNISLKEAKSIAENPLVEKTIPIALGDNYKGFRIVGTSADYVTQYMGELKEGEWNKQVLEVLLGSTVAEKTGLKKGDTFSGVHGFIEEGHHHDNHRYVVTGILKPGGTVLDRLIITNIESVWKVHSKGNDGKSECNHENGHDHIHEHEKKHHECEHDHNDEHNHNTCEHQHHNSEIAAILHKVEHHEELSEHEMNLYHAYKTGNKKPEIETGKEITALLVFFRNPMAATTLPRIINQNTKMQAASPSIELNRLMSLLGIGFNALRILAWIIIIFSAINIMIHLLNKLNQEIYEVALLRSLGVGRLGILLLLIWQGIILAFIGWVAGAGIVRLAILAINTFADNTAISMQYNFIGKELIILLYAIGVGLVSAIIPAIRAYRTDIHFLLNKL